MSCASVALRIMCINQVCPAFEQSLNWSYDILYVLQSHRDLLREFFLKEARALSLIKIEEDYSIQLQTLSRICPAAKHAYMYMKRKRMAAIAASGGQVSQWNPQNHLYHQSKPSKGPTPRTSTMPRTRQQKDHMQSKLPNQTSQPIPKLKSGPSMPTWKKSNNMQKNPSGQNRTEGSIQPMQNITEGNKQLPADRTGPTEWHLLAPLQPGKRKKQSLHENTWQQSRGLYP